MAKWDWWHLCSAREQVLSLPKLRWKSQLWLESDPWPGNSSHRGVAKKRKKKVFFLKKVRLQILSLKIMTSDSILIYSNTQDLIKGLNVCSTQGQSSTLESILNTTDNGTNSGPATC